MRRLALVLFGLLAACTSRQALEPIPAQPPAVEAADPPFRPCFVWMSEPRANSLIVSDIQTNPSWKRWTAAKPSVRCTLPAEGNWQAAFDFEVSDATLQHTGPITLTWQANGRPLGQMRCDHQAAYRFRAPLPEDMAGASVILEAVIDHPWVSPADGAKLGVLLTAVGFLTE